MSLSSAFNDTDASAALMYAVITTLAVTYIYYMARKLLHVKNCSFSNHRRDKIYGTCPYNTDNGMVNRINYKKFT